MGADPYHNLAPWHEDPRVSLRELQSSFVKEKYDLPKLIQEHLESSRDAVKLCEKDGDEYGLLELHLEEVQYAESIVGKPIPESAQDQIEIVRRLWQVSGEGVGNILDILDVSDEGGVFVSRQMTESEVEEYLGTPRPTAADATKLLEKIADDLGRGESVCMVVYEDNQPCGWWFEGYTVD